MATRAANRAIATYLFQTAGLDEATINIVIGGLKIDTPKRILSITSEQLLTGKKISVGDAVDILRLQRFINLTLQDVSGPPSSLDEWKEKITSTAFEEFETTRIVAEPSTPANMPVSRTHATETKLPTIKY